MCRVRACSAVRFEGREVPDATAFVRFNTNSTGSIVATGSDVSDHTPVTLSDRRMRAGAISIAVRATTPGDLVLYAHADGLESASSKVNIG